MAGYDGCYLLREFAGKKVHVACERCQIRRRFDGDAMIERAGLDAPLPDLLTQIAVGMGCNLNIAPTPNGIRCGLKYDGPSVIGRKGKGKS